MYHILSPSLLPNHAQANRIFFNSCNSDKTRFWEDSWVADQPLKILIPRLFNL